MNVDLLYLQDHIELITACLELRARRTDAADAVRELAAELDICRQRIECRRREAKDLAATRLRERLQLSETEMMVVWCLATLVLSADARSLLTHVAGGEITLHALRQLVYGDLPSASALHELSDRGTLRRLNVLEPVDPATHETKQAWTLCSRVLAVLHGRDLENTSTAKPVDELTMSDGVVDALHHAIRGNGVVLVVGSPGLGRRTAITSVARHAGKTTLEIDARRLPSAPRLECHLRSLALDCKLFARVPLITNIDALDESALDLVEQHLVGLLDGLILATGRQHGPTTRWARPTILVEMTLPTSQQLEQVWHAALGTTCLDVSAIVTQFPLVPALIHRVAGAAKTRSNTSEPVLDDVQAAIRSVLDTNVGAFARRVTVTQTWSDIVLPAEHLGAVAELIARVRGRRLVYEEWGYAAKVAKGLGVTALFSGPPGTGKTMVASLIAQDLELPLYQVDLGQIVSKWIGETEKHLGQLFDAAEAGHAVLLFDEADALFAKRTDVKSSNDRNANMETNYLLQRLESFTGVCLLTTNHETHIDPAVQRRLSLHLRLDLPDVEERALLWRALIPESAPVAPDIDFDALARRFEMSGGYIRNASLRAAFIAAAKRTTITSAILEHSARRECEAMGRLV